jgi:hypothetical protein
MLQSDYNFCLSPSKILLPQSECTFCLNPRRPYILPRERERGEYLFYHFTPTLSRKSVCGQLLIRSIMVLLFNFEDPLKKIYQKKVAPKKRKKAKRTKKAPTKKGCPFFCVVVLCDYLYVQARVSSTV